MAKKRIKYDWGTSWASPNTGMVHPGNLVIDPNQTKGMPISTEASADPNAKSMSGMTQLAGNKVPSFKDKAGAFMNKNAGMITQAAGTIMPLLMKKADANAKPYKTGTKNLNNNMKRK